MDYRSAGVDVVAGRAFVERIRDSVETTRRPEVLGGLGGFGGLCRLPAGMKRPLLVAGTDGVGTKLELAQAHGAHHGVGIDLVALVPNECPVGTTCFLPLQRRRVYRDMERQHGTMQYLVEVFSRNRLFLESYLPSHLASQ